MTERLRVSFACNDPANGVFNDECAGVEVAESDGSHVITFLMLDIPMRWEVTGVVLDKEEFKVHGRTPWVGNWCWDETRMDEPEAERLVRWLIANAGSPDEWNAEHPIGKLAETDRARGMRRARTIAEWAERFAAELTVLLWAQLLRRPPRKRWYRRRRRAVLPAARPPPSGCDCQSCAHRSRLTADELRVLDAADRAAFEREAMGDFCGTFLDTAIAEAQLPAPMADDDEDLAKVIPIRRAA